MGKNRRGVVMMLATADYFFSRYSFLFEKKRIFA
jgi:hypothetical protein